MVGTATNTVGAEMFAPRARSYDGAELNAGKLRFPGELDRPRNI